MKKGENMEEEKIKKDEKEIEENNVSEVEEISPSEVFKMMEELEQDGEVIEEEQIEEEQEEKQEEQEQQEVEEQEQIAEEIKKQQELEELNRQIEEKEEELESIQGIAEYYESGRALNDNEQRYDMGEITEEEYEAEKEKIEKEYADIKNKKDSISKELNELKEKRDNLIGKDKDKTVEKEKVKSEEPDLEKSIKDNVEARNNSTGTSDGVSSAEKEQEEVEVIPEEQTTALQEYKKPNRFFSFFKKIINKIRNIGKKDKEQFQEVVSEELEKEGVNVREEELENSGFMQDLEQVYSEEEISKNTEEREIDTQPGKEKEADENKIV